MAVVPYTHMQLSRVRRDLQAALQRADWVAVAALDQSLTQALDQAASDKGRDVTALLRELAAILDLYKRLTKGCQPSSAHLSS